MASPRIIGGIVAVAVIAGAIAAFAVVWRPVLAAIDPPQPSSFDSAHAQWGETGTFSNGADDSRTVTVEVRWVSGTCSPTAKWSLTVRGNAP